ncbi:MAG: glycogen synthase, partial [Actinobacteria bacterium HGW-Actinobacteria-8]
MRIDILSREYPPHVYGGAGVHVNELAKELREHLVRQPGQQLGQAVQG